MASQAPDDDAHGVFSEADPALDPSITSISVTPGVNTSGRSNYFQTTSGPPTGNPEESHWNANSQFAPDEDSPAQSSENPPDSPSRAAAGARTGAELLRRLSLVDATRPEVADSDPRAVYPGLNLTGGLISATFCIPHTVTFRAGADWVRASLSCSRVLLRFLGSQIQTRYLGALRRLFAPFLPEDTLESYSGWLDRRDRASLRHTLTSCIPSNCWLEEVSTDQQTKTGSIK